tara:strand:+ start:17362 stop:19551 length:2190 start_codon:yes stop_codon:yes gene_type:complete
METVVVSAQKKNNPENVQDIPVAISAFGDAQLEALNATDLTDVGRLVPNAILSEIGTFKGVAAFSIRGQASQGSIPTVDPTVGTFVDGVYYGINAGIVMDTFDLESIEVLRGPQGILFGRNVVGGAVLVNTKRPTDVPSASFQLSADSGFRGTGNNYTGSAIFSGPLADGLNGKISYYRNQDDGWFENKYNSQSFGRSQTSVIRTAVEFQPTEYADFLLRLEYGEQEGDGTVLQSSLNSSGNPGLGFDPDTYDVSQDNEGLQRSEWSSATFETNIDVALGNGRITNIVGYREYRNQFCFDLDATPENRFNVNCFQADIGEPVQPLDDWGTEQEQFSNEFRYFGTFADDYDLTTGLYYFQQEIAYAENRSLFGDGLVGSVVRQSGGGTQDQTVFGVFANLDWRLNDRLTLSGGVRYTNEEKEARVASLQADKGPQPYPGFCVVTAGTCPYDFDDSTPGFDNDDSWSNVDFALGFNWEWLDNARIYGRWSTAQKSGGYNLRNSAASDSPGPVDVEVTDSFEVGLKSEPLSNLVFNAAAFYTQTEDLQKSVLANTDFGPSQSIRNTADVDIYGIEFDVRWAATDSLTFVGSLGLLDPEYQDVRFDISGDGVVDDIDLGLQLPRVSKYNAAFSVLHEAKIGSSGSLSSRASLTLRDEQFSADDNIAVLPSQELVDFNITYTPNDSNWSYSIYGKNVLNDVVTQLFVELPASIGSTYIANDKGRQIGARINFSF